MTPTITAFFADSPDQGQGLARDMRVRWALEEAGQSYDVRLVPFSKLKPARRAVNAFGQIIVTIESQQDMDSFGGSEHTHAALMGHGEQLKKLARKRELLTRLTAMLHVARGWAPP